MHKTFDVSAFDVSALDASSPAEIDVRLAAGDIEIDPTLDGRIEVELIAHDEESQRLVDEARIELHDHHGRPQLIVDVPNKSRGFSFALVFGRSGVSCRIRCPEGSLVSVRSKSADFRAGGRIGGLTVSTASGEVEAHRVEGGVNVKSASGDVSIREIGGSVNVQTASGDVELEIVRGAVNVATASGDLAVGEAYDDVNANTVSGDQEHRAVVRGHIGAMSVSGDVTIGVRRGSKVYLDCNTVSGDTTSELELTTDAPAGEGPMVEIRAKTVSGDIRITRAPAPADDRSHTVAANAVQSDPVQEVHS
jgi:Putative adhesin